MRQHCHFMESHNGGCVLNVALCFMVLYRGAEDTTCNLLIALGTSIISLSRVGAEHRGRMSGKNGGDVLIYAHPDGNMYYSEVFGSTDFKHFENGSLNLSYRMCEFQYRAPKAQHKGDKQ